jgi:hypothetical protein
MFDDGDSISLGTRDIIQAAGPDIPGVVYVVFPPNAQKSFPGWSKIVTIGDIDLDDIN